MAVYDDRISEWIKDRFAREDVALMNAREKSRSAGLPAISVSAEEGKFLQFLVGSIGAKRAIEIGTLGGYSGIWIARGLAAGGRLISLEVNPLHAEVARGNFIFARLDHRVEVRVGSARELLAGLSPDSPYDFVFIDADKEGYPDYFDWASQNLRVGGVIAAHNAFRQGDMFNRQTTDPGTLALRRLLEYVSTLDDWFSTIYPAGDGTLISTRIA